MYKPTPTATYGMEAAQIRSGRGGVCLSVAVVGFMSISNIMCCVLSSVGFVLARLARVISGVYVAYQGRLGVLGGEVGLAACMFRYGIGNLI